MITVDSYSTANITGYTYIAADVPYHGQSFTGNGAILSSAVVKGYKSMADATGGIVARIYSHTGTYGTTGIPDQLLATSDAIDVATLGTTAALITFTFSGANLINLAAGTYYVLIITISTTLGGSLPKRVYLGNDTSGYTHSGREMSWYNNVWLPQNGDMAFYVYASAYLKILTDTARAIESKTSSMARTLLDTVIQSATIARLPSKNLTSSVVVTGTPIRGVIKLLSDPVRHVVSFYRGVVRVITSTAVLTGTLSGLASRFKTLSDTTIATGSVVKLVTRPVIEDAKVSDSVVRKTGRAVVNVVTVTESITKFNQHTKTLSDTSLVTGTITKLRTAYRVSTDFVTLSVQQIRRLNGVVTMWAKTPKDAGSMTPVAKDTGSFTPVAKDTGTLTPVAKDTGQANWNKEMRDL